jgi:3-oxoacyl-[acyl-carrier-protein] synthase II
MLAITQVGQCLPFELAGMTPAEAANGVADHPSAHWFDVTERLGRRGYKYLPLASQLVAAAGRDLGQRFDAVAPESRTMFVSSVSSGSRMHTGMDATIRASSSDDLSPATAPFFSVNLTAGRLSTDLLTRGGVTTLTTPSTASLDALACADAAIGLGRCQLVVIASVEVPSAEGASEFDGSECGAVAFVAAPAVGSRSSALAVVTVRRGSWRPETIAADIDRLVIDTVGPQPFAAPCCICVTAEARPFVEAGVRGAVSGAGTFPTAVVPASPGSLAVSAAVGAAALGATAQLIVVAGALGHLGVALVQPIHAGGFS